MKTIKNQRFLVFQRLLSFRKAQFWYADFLIAVMIIMIIGVLFVVSIRDLTSRNEILKDLTLEASDISSVLMTEGRGSLGEWSNGIGTMGFITDNRFDENKFWDFLELSDEQQRAMLGTYNNVWIYLADRDGEIGWRHNLNYISINEIDANNLVHLKRFVFYDEDDDGKGDIYTLGVVVFQ